MIPISELTILDFIEWLKNKRQLPEEYIFELILNEQYYGQLVEYATTYLWQKRQDHHNDNYLFKKETIITPRTLIYESRRFIENENHLNSFYLMQYMNIGIAEEIDFLEWLMDTYKDKPIDLDKMPNRVFEILADEYCKATKKDIKVKKELVRSFKKANKNFLLEKLENFLTIEKLQKMKNLKYIYDRYSEPTLYKCFFLHLSVSSKEFQQFINRYWIDLNSLSGNTLDIFYSNTDLKKSGYMIKEYMFYLPKTIKDSLPCIVLWKDKITNARGIDISCIDWDDVFKLLCSIVGWMKDKYEFEEIIERAENQVEEFIERNRFAATNIITKVKNNYGIVSGAVKDSTIHMNNYKPSEIKQFVEESKQAIVLLRESVDINSEQKEILISIINEAREAVESNSVSKKRQSKEKFKYFMLGAGNTLKNVLTTLSAFTNLVKFFNI